MKQIIIAIVLSMCVLLTGCVTRVTVDMDIKQESLLQYCDDDTPELLTYTEDQNGNKVYNGKEVMRVLISWQDYYNRCATMHDALVDSIKEQSKMQNPSKK